MIHHEETRLKPNLNPNSNPKGVRKCKSAKILNNGKCIKEN